MEIEALKLLVIDALEDIKAEDIEVLDVRDKTDITDFMIIASGKSTRQVKALGDSVREAVKNADVMPLGTEGQTTGEWVLVDLTDIIVHIMLPAVREEYSLEKLWSVPAAERDGTE